MDLAVSRYFKERISKFSNLSEFLERGCFAHSQWSPEPIKRCRLRLSGSRFFYSSPGIFLFWKWHCKKLILFDLCRMSLMRDLFRCHSRKMSIRNSFSKSFLSSRWLLKAVNACQQQTNEIINGCIVTFYACLHWL